MSEKWVKIQNIEYEVNLRHGSYTYQFFGQEDGKPVGAAVALGFGEPARTEVKRRTALLIAAPELLEACVSIKQDLEDRLLDCDSPGSRETLETQIEYLSRAIAKAKGE
ncbi:hypothetical protein HQ520_02595 [bacterium]|nr:hypothetical protein [bacterium]